MITITIMVSNANYTYNVSLSLDAYRDKKISGAMIGTTRNEDNREIRKEYGYKANKGIGFKETTVTSEGLLESLSEGHVFCHLFNPAITRTDGTFGSSQKNNSNFKGSYVIGVDIDHTNYNSAEDFVSVLTCKPTFWYTSYSNQQEGKGARFRMIYVFNELIQNPYFFRYCAWNLNQSIIADTKEEIDDDCNLRCSQYFNGTNISNPDIIYSSGITNNVYSLSDFNVSESGWLEFLDNGCYYKTNTHKAEILDLYNKSVDILDDAVVEAEKESEITISKSLVSDMERLDYDEFMKYNRHRFHYFYRKEKEEWIDGYYQHIDDDYFCLPYTVHGYERKDGQHRRKTLYVRMCLRRLMCPDVDPDTILFNAYEDVHRFYDNSDGVLTIECLAENVKYTFSRSIEDIEAELTDTIDYLRSKAPKSGIILKRGISSNIAERNTYLKSVRWNLIADYYDPKLSINENQEIIAENLFPVSIRTLYRFCHEKGIDLTSNKDESIKSYLNPDVSIRKNLENIKKAGIKVSKDRISKLLAEIKEESNNDIVNDNVIFSNINNSFNNNNNTITNTTTYYYECQNKGQSESVSSISFGLKAMLGNTIFAK